jgi:hypothetical protein
MTESQGPEPKPSASRGPDSRPADSQGINLTPADSRTPGPKPAGDDIRWLIYLAIGLVAFLAIVAWSGFHNAMGH